MAIKSAGAALLQGRFSDSLAYLFVDQDTVDEGTKADDALRQINKRKFDNGDMTQEEFDAFTARSEANAFPTYADPDGQIFQQEGTNVTAGLVEGAKEGLANTQKNIKSVLGGGIGWVAGAIPWQVWVIGLCYLGYVLWPYFFAKKK